MKPIGTYLLLAGLALGLTNTEAVASSANEISMYTVEGTVSYIRDRAIAFDDIEFPLADNVSIVDKKGRPASIKTVHKGAKVELLVLPNRVVQEIRLK